MAKNYQTLESTIRSIYESKMMRVNVKGEGGATVPARTEKEAITKAFRKLGIATRFTKDARFMKGVTVSESFGDEDEHVNCDTEECCGECDESKEQPIEEAKVDELSRDTLSNYMSKSAASVYGKDAKTQDKRISGQSMADKKLRKADGKSSDAKVAATEENIYTVRVSGGIMRPGSTERVTVNAKSPEHAIKKVKKNHLNRHKGEFKVAEEVQENVLEDFVNEDKHTTGPGVKMGKPIPAVGGKTQKVGGKLSHPPRKPNRLKPDPMFAKKEEGAMKRMATQDAERERLGPKKVKGSGMDTFKPKPKNEDMDKAMKGQPVGVSVTMVHKDTGRKQTTKFPGTHSAVAGAKSHIAQMQKKGFKVHSKNLMYGKNEAEEMGKKVKGKKGEEDIMINPTVKEVREARHTRGKEKKIGSLPVTRSQLMDLIGNTQNSDQAVAIIRKEFRVSNKVARDAMKIMMDIKESYNEIGTPELTKKYADATPGQIVPKPEVAPTARELDQMPDPEGETLTTYQKSLKSILSRLKEI